MAHTTVTDFEDYAGETYDAPQQARIGRLIPRAERQLERRVGQDFYTSGTDTVADEDWVYATCVITDWLFTLDSEEARQAIAGPYQSERLGDYSYTLKDDAKDGKWTIWKDFRIRDILATYSTVLEGNDRVYATAASRDNPRVETTEIGSYYLP